MVVFTLPSYAQFEADTFELPPPETILINQLTEASSSIMSQYTAPNFFADQSQVVDLVYLNHFETSPSSNPFNPYGVNVDSMAIGYYEIDTREAISRPLFIGDSMIQPFRNDMLSEFNYAESESSGMERLRLNQTENGFYGNYALTEFDNEYPFYDSAYVAFDWKGLPIDTFSLPGAFTSQYPSISQGEILQPSTVPIGIDDHDVICLTYFDSDNEFQIRWVVIVAYIEERPTMPSNMMVQVFSQDVVMFDQDRNVVQSINITNQRAVPDDAASNPFYAWETHHLNRLHCRSGFNVQDDIVVISVSGATSGFMGEIEFDLSDSNGTAELLWQSYGNDGCGSENEILNNWLPQVGAQSIMSHSATTIEHQNKLLSATYNNGDIMYCASGQRQPMMVTVYEVQQNALVEFITQPFRLSDYGISIPNISNDTLYAGCCGDVEWVVWEGKTYLVKYRGDEYVVDDFGAELRIEDIPQFNEAVPMIEVFEIFSSETDITPEFISVMSGFEEEFWDNQKRDFLSPTDPIIPPNDTVFFWIEDGNTYLESNRRTFWQLRENEYGIGDSIIRDQPYILEIEGVLTLEEAYDYAWAWVADTTGGSNNNAWRLQNYASKVFVGIDDVPYTENDIVLYPNPANDWIQILSDNPVQHLRIIDMSGRIVRENNRMSAIEVNGLPAGTYIAEITIEGNVHREKAIVH